MRHSLTELMALERLAGGWPQRRKDNFRVEEHEFYVIRMLISPPQLSLCAILNSLHMWDALYRKKRRAIKTHVSEKCYTSYICISPECRANSKAFMSPSDHNWYFWKNWKLCPFPSDSDSFHGLRCSTKLFFAVSCWGFEKKSGSDKKYLQKLLSLSQVDFQKKSLKYLTPLRIGSMVQNTRCQIWRMPEFFNHNFLHLCCLIILIDPLLRFQFCLTDWKIILKFDMQKYFNMEEIFCSI